MNAAQINRMVDAFLQWKFPADFQPDGGISFKPFGSVEGQFWPTGTNLLTAGQARDMIVQITKHIDDLEPAPTPAPSLIPPYQQGLVQGAKMTDVECLRFYNGIRAACSLNGGIPAPGYCSDPKEARKRLPEAMDILAGAGMVATVGYAGTPIIKPH